MDPSDLAVHAAAATGIIATLRRAGLHGQTRPGSASAAVAVRWCTIAARESAAKECAAQRTSWWLGLAVSGRGRQPVHPRTPTSSTENRGRESVLLILKSNRCCRLVQTVCRLSHSFTARAVVFPGVRGRPAAAVATSWGLNTGGSPIAAGHRPSRSRHEAHSRDRRR
jgi:hypothetical protein